MNILLLSLATLVPILLSGLFTILDHYTKFSSFKYIYKQIIIGFVFGIYSIFSTEFGIPIVNGAIMNVRDAGPMCAGLIFGGPAGIIAGTIGGVYRYACIYWGGVEYTALACSLSTFLAGVFSALMRKSIFENDAPGAISGFGLGSTMEVLHMLLILVTNYDDTSQAFAFVHVCTIPMAACNGIGVGGAVLVSRLLYKREVDTNKQLHINQDFALKLLICVVVAFGVTCLFTHQIIYRITTAKQILIRRVTVYLVAFMEVLIFVALFILIYELIKKNIINNIKKINNDLNKITCGELDTQVEVRDYAEFSELSNYINDTVDTLKCYISDAENRINQELEFASKIQYSALPHTFPIRDDFNIYASMSAAKEVGGDFYDFYLTNPFTLVFLIADVSGKGIPASLFMMTAKTMLRDMAERGLSVDRVFTKTNNKLCRSNDAEMFLTAWMGKLDLRTGKLEFCNAGHNYPVLIQDGKAQFLKSKANFVLAGLPDFEYHRQEIFLKPGDMLYLYTDGVTEATSDDNGQKVLFGDNRLLELANKFVNSSPKEFCESVSKELVAFAGSEPQSDDITMLSVRLTDLVDAKELISEFEKK